MCGRLTQIRESVTIGEIDLPLSTSPRYNAAPTDAVSVIILEEGLKIVPMRWGLIPSWSSDPSIGNRLINARAETVAEKPAFRESFRKHRCVIPADGFYEWTKEGKTKTPYYIHHAAGDPFFFAGLYSEWNGELTCAVITTEANDVVRRIHDRMPVILSQENVMRWLEHPDASLLVPCPDEVIAMHTVSRLVNAPGSDSPACIEPLA